MHKHLFSDIKSVSSEQKFIVDFKTSHNILQSLIALNSSANLLTANSLS